MRAQKLTGGRVDLINMRAVLAGLLAAGLCLMAVAPAASADEPQSAVGFRDSVGLVTHIVYYDTAYADWPRIVSKLDEVGVRHVREGVYANPEWRDWNQRYYDAVELASSHGIRFMFGMGQPGSPAGTLDQLINVVSGRLRRTVEALEAPNEFDHFVGGPRWPSELATYDRALYRGVKANSSLRSLPVLGPSFGTVVGPRLVGDQRVWLDRGNVHPYTDGLSPEPRFVRDALARASVTAGRKPVWASEAGFHNALRSPREQSPVSEEVGAVYLLRTFLEHFKGGIDRTYAYELIDEKPDRGGRDPEQHYGLLRNDFTPKPAFTGLKNLLTLVGRDHAQPRLRPLRVSVHGEDGGVRRLVLQKADGTYLVALWRLSSMWDRERRRPERVAPHSLVVRVPDAARVASADPMHSAATHALRLHHGRVRIDLAGRPIVLHVTPRRPR